MYAVVSGSDCLWGVECLGERKQSAAVVWCIDHWLWAGGPSRPSRLCYE